MSSSSDIDVETEAIICHLIKFVHYRSSSVGQDPSDPIAARKAYECRIKQKMCSYLGLVPLMHGAVATPRGA
jgi:hypothetical protein